MAIRTLDLSAKNVAFARLQSKAYTSQYTPVPNSALPKSMQADLGVIYKELTGEEMSQGDNTLLVKADSGVMIRMFTPVVVNQNHKFAIKWGQKLVELNVVDGKLTNDTKCVFKPGVFNFSGRGNDNCIFIQVKSGADTIRMPLVVRMADYNNQLEPAEFAVMFEDDLEELLPLIAVNKQGNGGSSAQAETISFKNLDEGEYTITGYREVTTSYGINHILMLKGVPGFSDGVQCWGHNSIKNVLLSKPVISEQEPATLTIISKTERADGKIRVHAAVTIASFEDDDEMMDINF